MAPSNDAETCGIGIRGVAIAIDSIVWFFLWFVAIFPVAFVTGDIRTGGGTVDASLTGAPAALALGLWLALAIGYHATFEWQFGKTVGKYLVRIEVVAADGSPLPFDRSLKRNVLRLVDFLPILYAVGIALVATSERHQRLGDRVADTLVVRR